MVDAQGQAKWAKVANKSSTYVTHKNPTPPIKKIFFECKLQDLLRLIALRPSPQC